MPQNSTNGNLRIMTWTKAIVVVMIAGTLAYCTIQQIPLEGDWVKFLFAALGLKEIVSGVIYNAARD